MLIIQLCSNLIIIPDKVNNIVGISTQFSCWSKHWRPGFFDLLWNVYECIRFALLFFKFKKTLSNHRFLALIFLYTLETTPWKNYFRFWKWNLKRTPQSVQNLFSRKLNLKFCIAFNMIWFANALGSVKIRLACSKVLLIINYLIIT